MMKKVTLIFFTILLCSLTLQAVEPIRWGVIGGMNLSNIKKHGDNKFGYHGGVKAELPLNNGFYLEGSLLFTKKGYKYDKFVGSKSLEGNLYRINLKETLWKGNRYMLEIPIHFGYKHRIVRNVSLFASTGIYLGYGLFGKQDGAIMERESLLENPDDPGFQFDYGSRTDLTVFEGDTYKGSNSEKRFDWGAGIKVGAEFWNHFQVSANYNWGLNNLRNDTDFNSRNLMVSCAYLF